MQQEYLDLYDENNQPLNITKPRSEIHSGAFWHRTAVIFIINDSNELLIHLRSPHKDLNPNRWDTKFGGHVLAGSDYDTTIISELEQEIGLNVSLEDLKSIGIHKYNGKNNLEHMKAFVYKFNGDVATLKFNDQEVVEVKWMPLSDILPSIQKNPDNWSASAEGFKKTLELLNNI